MKNTLLATFDQRAAAERLRDRLQRAGLPAVINDESNVVRIWFMSDPRAAVHVEVNDTDYVEARRLISELDASEGIMKEAVRCPECGSSRIEFPQITRKFAMPMVEALLMKLQILPRGFFCRDCQCIWPERETKPPELDALGFPRKRAASQPPTKRKD